MCHNQAISEVSMTHYERLYKLARDLQSEMERQKLPRLVLEHAVEAAKANRGFIVTKELGQYRVSHQIHFDRRVEEKERRRFSRGLIRECLNTGKPIFTANLTSDDRFRLNQSAQRLGQISVVACPLSYSDEIYGVIYLESKKNQAFDNSAQTFLLELADLTGLHLRNALEYEALQQLTQKKEIELFAQYNFGEVIGRHPSMISLLDQVRRIADSEATVLINGETGTGKELIARAIYLNSKRKNKPFVTLHCGALPESLFEAELFGYKRGSFTGAVKDRMGRVSKAEGGTLFIDEVGEIPMSVQAKLLRFFQFGEFQRIGSDRAEKVDVRILTATHRDLAAMTAAGQFREDLYYRLKVITVRLPPLRERRSDIPLLIKAFLKKKWARQGEPRLSPCLNNTLLRYDYPGNVRELFHLIERFCVLADGALIDESLLPEEVPAEYAQQDTSKSWFSEPSQITNEDLKEARKIVTRRAVDKIEIDFLKSILKHHKGSVLAAAKQTGMQKTYIYKLLRKHGLNNH